MSVFTNILRNVEKFGFWSRKLLLTSVVRNFQDAVPRNRIVYSLHYPYARQIDIVGVPSDETKKKKKNSTTENFWGWDVAQLVERRTGTPLRQVGFPGAARDFFPQLIFSADSLTVSVQPSCAIACINTVSYTHLTLPTS